MRIVFCSCVLLALGCSDPPARAVPQPSAPDTNVTGSGTGTPVFDTLTADGAPSDPGGGTGATGGEEDGFSGTGEPDVLVEENGFLWPCDSNSDCDSGFCVNSDQGTVCSKFCLDDCPDGWLCKEVANTGQDATFICTFDSSVACQPCLADIDCGGSNLCLNLGSAGAFCGVDCSIGGACPDDFLCSPIPQSDGTTAEQCVPLAGECPCLGEYDGLETACSVQNTIGTCPGTRLCQALEWTSCDADTPAVEVCNGLDDDCSGLADDGLAAEPCENTNQTGTCQGQNVCVNGQGSCTAPVPTAEFCDLVDNDCDGATDEIDDVGTQTCGLGDCAQQISNCIECIPYNGADVELCDTFDNDCNGATDELWPQLGQSCDGPDSDQCQTGSWTCSQDGTGAVCGGDDQNSVEICNGADDDCNGAPDDGLGDTTCGLGICLHTVANCSGGQTQTCNPMEGAQGSDQPDASFVDSNCDGVDGDATKAVFVDGASGSNSAAGTMAAPVKTITKALTLSSSGGKNQILVSQGAYSGQVVLKNGVGVYGGYNAAAGWSRSAGNTVTLQGHTKVVTGSSLNAATVLSRLNITADSNPAVSGSSYGVAISGSSGVEIRNCTIHAGSGGAGSNGSTGTKGSNGVKGGDGKPGCEDGGSVSCSDCNAPGVGVGDSGTCGNKGGNGGSSAKGDSDGAAGSKGSGTSGGVAGTKGTAGNNGGPGGTGGGGLGGNNGNSGGNVGTLSSSSYSPSNGTTGTSGSTASGGGGGGGGGGDQPGFLECNSYGGTGGAGGSGGCGGAAGVRGTGGGGSFAVYVYAGAITIKNSSLSTSSGGKGGNGGNGGNGGTGGAGGDKGEGGDEDSTSGGNGGKGGKGGNGGHGGGGGGGPSLGVACGNNANLTISSTPINPGSGGAPGVSSGNSGSSGKSGQKHGCL